MHRLEYIKKESVQLKHNLTLGNSLGYYFFSRRKGIKNKKDLG